MGFVKNAWFKSKLLKMNEQFRYGVFSRFWIQSCLELFMNSLVGILYTEFANTLQIVDFLLCCCVLVIFI